MFAQSYADIVRRDMPQFWWRHGNVNADIPNSGLGTSVMAKATNAPPPGGFGIPGANGQGGLGRCQGDQTTVNNDGWGQVPAADFTVTDYLALELWVYPHTGFTASRRYGLMYRYSTSNSTLLRGMTVSTDGKLECQLNSQTVTSTDVLLTSQWNHCVVNVPYSAGAQAEVWLNGDATVANASFAGTGLWTSANQPFAVGRSRGSSVSYSPPAYLAEAAVYPYRLTGQQITDHYQAGLDTRMRSSLFTAVGYPFPQTAPSPGGLTSIGDVINRRIALVSDRPR